MFPSRKRVHAAGAGRPSRARCQPNSARAGTPHAKSGPPHSTDGPRDPLPEVPDPSGALTPAVCLLLFLFLVLRLVVLPPLIVLLLPLWLALLRLALWRRLHLPLRLGSWPLRLPLWRRLLHLRLGLLTLRLPLRRLLPLRLLLRPVVPRSHRGRRPVRHVVRHIVRRIVLNAVRTNRFRHPYPTHRTRCRRRSLLHHHLPRRHLGRRSSEPYAGLCRPSHVTLARRADIHGIHRLRLAHGLRRHAHRRRGDGARAREGALRHHRNMRLIHIRHVGDVDVGNVGDVGDIHSAHVSIAHPVTGPVHFPRPQRNPGYAASAPNPHRHAEPAAAHKGHQRRRVHRARDHGSRNPHPTAAQHGPAAVVERSKAPWRIVNPGPAPRRHKCPVPVPVRLPAHRHARRGPDGSVCGVVAPHAVVGQIPRADHFGRHITG